MDLPNIANTEVDPIPLPRAMVDSEAFFRVASGCALTVELTVRFLTKQHSVIDPKDQAKVAIAAIKKQKITRILSTHFKVHVM